jgi:hypothetical protein
MKRIPLSRGIVALVDDDDYDELIKYRWFAQTIGYAVRNLLEGEAGFPGMILMHRQLLGLRDKRIGCDHVNGNGFDNRRNNLRQCTQAENLRNRGPQRNNTSGYKGVGWCKHTGSWRARITLGRKEKHLGLFSDSVVAAHAYDEAAKKYHGDFARLNFPEDK